GKKIMKEQINQFLLLLMIFAFFPPIFFIQKVVPWNAIQFFYYFIFLFSFFAAEGLVFFFLKIKFKVVKIAIAVLIIAASLPSTIETIHWFTAPVPTTLLDQKEVEALKFLKDNSKQSDVLLTYPFGEVQAKYFNPPAPMTYYNSPYVSFFTERRIYLEDQNAANLLSYDAQKRLNEEKEFFSFLNPSSSQNFLLKHPEIKFIYLVDSQGQNLKIPDLGLKEVFNNQKVRIYQVGW
ncbi:MAG: hypothetical protein Q8Q24_01610, partial [bacterium]|nr:hypothetical protein [bacterium]